VFKGGGRSTKHFHCRLNFISPFLLRWLCKVVYLNESTQTLPDVESFVESPIYCLVEDYVYSDIVLDWYITEEFVAHSSNVNCLKIGKKSSRVLVTGGEDHKVNMWAIGKPNAILVCWSCYLQEMRSIRGPLLYLPCSLLSAPYRIVIASQVYGARLLVRNTSQKLRLGLRCFPECRSGFPVCTAEL
jgi:hypothetical protein